MVHAVTYFFLVNARRISNCYCCYKRLTLTPKNLTRSYKNLTKSSPKHGACGVAQSPYPIYSHGKAYLSKQLPWRAAGDPCLARSRSRVRAPSPAGPLHALFSPTSLPSSFRESVRVKQKVMYTFLSKLLGLSLDRLLAEQLLDLLLGWKLLALMYTVYYVTTPCSQNVARIYTGDL